MEVGNPSVTRPNGRPRVRCGLPVIRQDHVLDPKNLPTCRLARTPRALKLPLANLRKHLRRPDVLNAPVLRIFLSRGLKVPFWRELQSLFSQPICRLKDLLLSWLVYFRQVTGCRRPRLIGFCCATNKARKQEFALLRDWLLCDNANCVTSTRCAFLS